MLDRNENERFTEILRESIQEAMQGIVGDQAARALLYHVKFPESAGKPAEFAKNLQAILLTGSPVVEIAIVKRLWDKMGLFLVHADEPGSFEQRVGRARELYSQRQHQVVAR